MIPFLIGDAAVYTGDVLDILRTLPADSVHCVATSPPYFNLRDYKTGEWIGGDSACDHQHETAHQKQGATSARNGRANVDEQRNENFRSTCGKCGAARVDKQIGMEPTPAEYVQKLVSVFQEVRRVLHPSGVVWLNLGDSYSNSGMGGNPDESPYRKQATNAGSLIAGRKPPPGLKPKNLIGIPWMAAFALRDDGWYLRSDICWSKPNSMPESVQDRCSKSHEYIFMLAKQESYFYDNVAIFEPAVSNGKSGNVARKPATARGCPADGVDGSIPWEGDTRNKRTVWTVPTQSYEGAHFAVWPQRLVEPMILAGTSAHGVCPACLSPWERIVEKDRQPTRPALDSKVQSEKNRLRDAAGMNSTLSTLASFVGNRDPQRHCTATKTVGWEPTCTCERPDVIPATVLDPFSGSGTTLEVALKFNRRAVGIELNPDYVALIRTRLLAFQDREVGMFALPPEDLFSEASQ